MIKLPSCPREPFWLDILPGVRIRLRPISVAAVLIARARVVEKLRDLAASATEEEKNALCSAVFVTSLAKSGVVAWEGVVGADGAPAPVTPENIDAALSILPVFDALDRRYVGPYLSTEDEKNASAPSPNGASAGATDIAAAAA
jgi:hypothetical protein